MKHHMILKTYTKVYLAFKLYQINQKLTGGKDMMDSIY